MVIPEGNFHHRFGPPEDSCVMVCSAPATIVQLVKEKDHNFGPA